MAKHRRIVIVGAGPAGSSLAIRLARAGIDVTLIDKDMFPREKLCGEFISPECLEHFDDLGIRSELLALGGDRITETRFFSAGGHSVGVPTDWFGKGAFALSLSRAEMDHALYRAATRTGVRVAEGSRVVSVVLERNGIRSLKVRTRDGICSNLEGDIFVDASGRAAVLSNLAGADRSPSGPGADLVGFKAHLDGVQMEKSICEIYFFDGGYAGLSHVEAGRSNFCFLVKAELARKFIGNTNKLFQYIVNANTRACERMRTAVPVNSWLAVKIDSFGERNKSSANNLIAIGDAGAFMDPFTGSGILMALESGKLAAEVLLSREFRPDAYYAAHRRVFQKRLAVASILRRAAFSHRLAAAAIRLAGLSDRFRGGLAKATRPGSEPA